MNAFITPTPTLFTPSTRLSSSTCSFASAPLRSRPATRPAPIRACIQSEDDHLGEPVLEKTKLFVGNLSWDTTDASLSDAFAAYGTVIDSRVVCDRFTGKSRGFGFIEYDQASCAEDALVGMNGIEIDGRNVRVDRANRRPSHKPRRNDNY